MQQSFNFRQIIGHFKHPQIAKNQTTENPTTPKPNAKLDHFIYNKKVYIKWFTQV